MLIDIIEAGIGILTTANGFEQKGIKTRILDNALQVYDKLGLSKVAQKFFNAVWCKKMRSKMYNLLF